MLIFSQQVLRARLTLDKCTTCIRMRLKDRSIKIRLNLTCLKKNSTCPGCIPNQISLLQRHYLRSLSSISRFPPCLGVSFHVFSPKTTLELLCVRHSSTFFFFQKRVIRHEGTIRAFRLQRCCCKAGWLLQVHVSVSTNKI